MSTIKNNTTELQNILNTINNLPEAGSGGALPELTNEGTASDLMANKELIDGEGNKVVGTFTIDNELSTQDNLISQIQTAINGKASGTAEDLDAELTTQEELITQLGTILNNKASNSGNIETYDLVIESDGITKLIYIQYVAYVNNEYQLHDDSFSSNQSYPLTLHNVVLKTPLRVQVNGGMTPLCGIVSNIKRTCSINYNSNESMIIDNQHFIPLETENGQIIIRCYDDD